MPKILTNNMLAHLESEEQSLATCVKLTTRYGAVLGFTDHDTNLYVGGVTYYSASGQVPAEVTAKHDLTVSSLTLLGLIGTQGITEAGVYGGDYNDAYLELFLVNYNSIADGTIPLKSGWVGEFKLGRDAYTCEFRELTQRLQQTIGEVYSYTCRAELGDSRCKVSLGSYTVTGAIDTTDGWYTFYDASRTETQSYFVYGKLTWLSGANSGRILTVWYQDKEGNISFSRPTSYQMVIGDTYSLIAGCNKQFNTCKSKFSNVINYHGEPRIKGTESLYTAPPILNDNF